MEPRLIKRTIDLALDVQRDPGWGQRLMLVGSALADRLELSVHNAGVQADLTGLTGVVYFKTAEGDVIETGEVGGNLVAVDFPAEAYAFEGTMVVQVFLSDGKRNVPLYQEVFDIGEGRSDVLIDPSGIVPDLPSVLAMLGELNASKTACDEATVRANNAADAANAASGRAESVIGAVEESATSANNAAATAEAAGKAVTEAAAQMSGVIKEATDAATAANSAANRVDVSIQAAANAADAANGAAARVDSSIQAAVDATSEANTAAENANTATTNANNATVRADAAAEALEKAPVPTGTVSTYQAGTSPTTPPTGTWQSTIPAVPQGQYLWTRTVQSYTNGNPTTYYSVAHQGMDGSGSVASVDGVSPDGSGNVQLGAVRSVNGSMPDEDGNVTIETGGGDVQTVDGVAPDPETGDVPLNAANRDTYMLRLTAEEYEARTLAQRQQDYADGVRGYLVGSGDSVRYWYVLNEDGTTTPQADPGAVQRGEKVELAADSEMLGGKPASDYVLVSDGAGAHNAIYRGKYIGNAVTAEQYAAIADGTFRDLFIGDYWTIGGVTYRIAAFDYYLLAGNTDMTTHHVTLVPDGAMYTHVMNDSNVTTGGYVGSKMYTTGLADAKTTINNAFGSAHILTHRQHLCNAVSNGTPSSGSWYDSTVELMTEKNVYGGKVFGSVNNGSTIPVLYTVDKSQYPLFAFRPDLISNRTSFWLRDVVSATSFATVAADGVAHYYIASSARGVRPAFSIKS